MLPADAQSIVLSTEVKSHISSMARLAALQTTLAQHVGANSPIFANKEVIVPNTMSPPTLSVLPIRIVRSGVIQQWLFSACVMTRTQTQNEHTLTDNSPHAIV
jgi:hypothetical protein